MMVLGIGVRPALAGIRVFFAVGAHDIPCGEPAYISSEIKLGNNLIHTAISYKNVSKIRAKVIIQRLIRGYRLFAGFGLGKSLVRLGGITNDGDDSRTS